MATQSRNKIKCSDCRNFSAAPVFGHFKCVRHRACSGKQEWQPDECDICVLYKHNSCQWEHEEKDSSLDKFYNMLEEASTELSNDMVTWEFVDNFNSFFDIQIPDREHLEDGEIPTNSESPVNEANEQISSAVTNQNDTEAQDLTTNDLLHRVISGLQDISVSLRPILSQIQTRDSNTNSDSNIDNLSRKRQRSSSSRRSEYDNNSDGADQSDVDQGSIHSEPFSPPDSRRPAKRRRGNDYFIEGSTIYFYTDDHRRVANKVWFNGQLRDAKWHPTIDAFSLLTTSTTDTPFMSSTQAHESLVSQFNAMQDPSEKPGLDRKSYRIHFDDSTGLAHALRLIKQETPDALHNLYTGDYKSYWKLFSNSAFKPSTMVNFSSGWTLTGQDYLKWAKKNDKLNTKDFSREIQLSYTPIVPHRYLEEECSTRARVVDSISGLSMLDSLAKEVKSNINTHTTVEAISRHYLSLLSDTTLRWYVAKMNVRKIVLQGSQTPQAADLIESNMWEPSVFGKEAVRLLIDGDVPRIGIQKRLALSFFTNKYYEKWPKRVNPEKLGKQPISTSVASSSTTNQFFPQQTNQGRNQDSYENPDQYNKKRQFQNNFNKKGGRGQRAGYTHQRNRRGAGNKNKFWNNPKQRSNGPAGVPETSKGNKTAQQ